MENTLFDAFLHAECNYAFLSNEFCGDRFLTLFRSKYQKPELDPPFRTFSVNLTLRIPFIYFPNTRIPEQDADADVALVQVHFGCF